MRARLSLILTLAAWLLATGSHWDLVQTFAWGNMIASYAQKMSLAAAVKKTFSAETMCHLCHAVADAKKSQSGDSATPGPKSIGKVLLVCAPDRSTFFSPSAACLGVLPELVAPMSAERTAPPSPPPRLAA